MIVRYEQLTACENAQEPQCGTNYYHDGSACVACPAGKTRQPGAANVCTSNTPTPAPTPAKSKKQKAEERAESMTAGITDPRQKKKAEKLAAAAIGGVKVNKVKFAQTADNADDAAAKGYTQLGMSSSLGVCVATLKASGRRLASLEYDLEFFFSADEVDDTALSDAVQTLNDNGVEATTASVDIMDELEDIPGVDTAELAAFKTEASEAAAEVEVLPPPPPPPPPPPNLILDDDDHAPGRAGTLIVTVFAALACVVFM